MLYGDDPGQGVGGGGQGHNEHIPVFFLFKTVSDR